MKQEITMGSLFSGSGGFELAGSIFGIRPIWASEIEPFPILVTTKNLRYLNVNNTAGNANWNIGAALFYLKRNNNPKQSCFLHR